jgi:O-antigen/teichoic acid export membrane protein
MIRAGSLINRPRPSLRTNFRWTLGGNLAYSLCQWGTLSVLAKAGSASLVGQFALGLAVSAPVFMLTNLALRAVQVTDGSGEYRFADYFTLRLLTTALGLGIVTIVDLTSHFNPETRWIIFMVAMAKSLESLSDIVGGLLQLQERLDQVAVSLVVRGTLSIVVFAATFLLSHNLVAATAGMALTWLAVLAGYDLPRASEALRPRERFLHLDRRPQAKLVLLALPLGLGTMLLSLNGNIPRYLLEHYGGPAQLGRFASLAYVLLAASTIVNALGQSATVRLSCLFAAGDLKGFKRIMFTLVSLGIAASVLGLPLAAVVGRRVLSLLYRPEYADQLGAFVIMVAAGGVSAVASFLGYGLTAARSFRAQVPLTVAGTLTTAVVCALLVPHRGLLGAALGLLASALVLALGCALVLRATLSAAGQADTSSYALLEAARQRSRCRS